MPECDLVFGGAVDENGDFWGLAFHGWIPHAQTRFHLIGHPELPDSARTIFDQLQEIPSSAEFVSYSTSIPLEANQIWAVCTKDSTFAKLLLLQARAVEDTVISGDATFYGELTFDWVFQVNGSRSFLD